MKLTANNRAAVLVHFLHKYLIWLIILSYIAAALLPQMGLWIRRVDLGSILPIGNVKASLPPLMLGMLLFNAGMGVSIAELRNARHKAPIIVAGVFGNIAAPLAMIVVISLTMTLWHDQEEVQQLLVGLALVAAMPIAGASTAWAQNASGSLVLSLGLVLLTTLLSPLTTPIILHAVGFLTTGDYSEDLHELASGEAAAFLGTWVILPSFLGIACRRFMGDQNFARVTPFVKLSNFLVLVLLNYSNATLVLPEVVSTPDADFLLAVGAVVSLLCVAGFGCGFLLSRVLRANRSETASLMFGLGMNNNGSGLVLASIALIDHPQVMLPIILYNLVQHLFASTVDFGLLRLGTQNASDGGYARSAPKSRATRSAG
jgi:BASS family bile acid:Na+ symporter